MALSFRAAFVVGALTSFAVAFLTSFSEAQPPAPRPAEVHPSRAVSTSRPAWPQPGSFRVIEPKSAPASRQVAAEVSPRGAAAAVRKATPAG